MSEACFIRIISKHQLISVNDLISTGQRAINHQEWCRWRDCFDTGQVQANFIFPWALSGTSESVYSITVSHPVLSHHTCQGLPQITISSGEERDVALVRARSCRQRGVASGEAKVANQQSAAALWHKLPPAHRFSYDATAHHNSSEAALQKVEGYEGFWWGQAP